jgi:molybdopterin converting factor small subunit
LVAMRIIIRVFGDISKIIGKRHELELPECSTVTAATARVGEKTGQQLGYLGDFQVGGKDLAILLNGKSIYLLDGTKTKLKDGDEVVIMQPTAGG